MSDEGVHHSVQDFIDDLKEIMRRGHHGQITLHCDGQRIGNYEMNSYHEPGEHAKGERDITE